jgi:hypothetical protein
MEIRTGIGAEKGMLRPAAKALSYLIITKNNWKEGNQCPIAAMSEEPYNRGKKISENHI